MGDLHSGIAIWGKGILFVLLGTFAAALLLMFAPDWRVAGLLCLSIWAFCRAYYFAFYVIEHYVDPGYKFAGLIDFLKYSTGMRRS